MFFVKAGSEPLLFSLDDLILAEDVVQGNLVTNVKKKVPVLNITSIYTQVSFILQFHYSRDFPLFKVDCSQPHG